jgi:hypothetical protein
LKDTSERGLARSSRVVSLQRSLKQVNEDRNALYPGIPSQSDVGRDPRNRSDMGSPFSGFAFRWWFR